MHDGVRVMSDDEIFDEYVRSRRVAIESSLDFLVYYVRVKVSEIIGTFGDEKDDSE